jgi:hypothetical protein
MAEIPTPRNEDQQVADLLAANKILDEKRAAEFVGLSHSQLCALRRRGAGGPVFVRLSPRRLGYRVADLIEFITRRRVGGMTEAK